MVAINLNNFYIDDAVITEIKTIRLHFVRSKQGQSKLSEKYGVWEGAQQKVDYEYYVQYPESVLTKVIGIISASGWSDQDIDDVIERDRNAY